MADYIERQAVVSDFEWSKSQAIDKDRWQEAIDRINALPSADELTIVTEYCRKRNLVIVTIEFSEFCKQQYATFYAKDKRS